MAREARLNFWRGARLLGAERPVASKRSARRQGSRMSLPLAWTRNRQRRVGLAARRSSSPMTDTIATLLDAHANGKALTATIEETYERIGRHGDPALFITLRPKAEALAEAEQAAGERIRRRGRCSAFRSRSRTTSTSRACRRPPLAQPSPTRPSVRPSSSSGSSAPGAIVIGKTNLDQFATGLVGMRSPYGVPRNALRADLIPGGSSSGLGGRGRGGACPFFARHRHRGLGPRAGGAQRNCRAQTLARRAVRDRRRSGLPDARHHLDLRARRRRRVHGLRSRRGLRSGGRLVAALSGAGAVGLRPKGCGSAFRAATSSNSSATRRPKPPSRATSPRRRRSARMSSNSISSPSPRSRASSMKAHGSPSAMPPRSR